MSMTKNLRSRLARLTLCGCLVWTGQAMADEGPADKILAEIKAVEMPARPKNLEDQAAVQAYLVAQRAASQKKSELIGNLFEANPDNSELASLLPLRWQTLRSSVEAMPKIRSEVDAIIAKSHDEKLLGEAYYMKAALSLPDKSLADFDTFAQKYPKDRRVSSLLYTKAVMTKDLEEQERLFKRIETDYADTTAAKQVVGARARAEGERKRMARVGKPFELEFTDAIKGSQVTMASLKGKVVVVDFWATWCGPCVAEMPNMKKLYAKFKDQGVEFVGISLDQPKEMGGLDKLKDYVAKNEIEWPQYYQGNYWKSEFSSSWGINAIPCVFLIDADGNLASIDARGKLETMIPEYLEKAKSKKTAANP